MTTKHERAGALSRDDSGAPRASYLGDARESFPPPDDEETYLGPGVTPLAMGGFFRAAAALHRTAPWALLPDAGATVHVEAEKLAIRDAVVALGGSSEETFRVLFFATYEDFRSYRAAADAIAEGQAAEMPVHAALEFDRSIDVGAALRREVGRHGWVLDGADAYPSIVVGSGASGRVPTADELVRIEAMTAALAEWLADGDELRVAWRTRASARRMVAPRTTEGSIALTLTTPHDADRVGEQLSLFDRRNPYDDAW